MIDYLLAVRHWVDAVERVANTSPSFGLAADPADPRGWAVAHDAERATAAVLMAGASAWPSTAQLDAEDHYR